MTIAVKAGTGTSGAVLSGQKTVNGESGLASFPGIAIDRAGTGYVLTASPDSLAAESHPFAVDVGYASAWGANGHGLPSEGTAAWRPRQAVLIDAKQVSACEGHSLAAKADGAVWAWG